jgi:hypothetical protein
MPTPTPSIVALAAAILSVSSMPATAQSPAAAPTAAPATDISVVTVLGKLPKRVSATVRRLDKKSASSCAFDVSTAAADQIMDDYLDHFHGRGRDTDDDAPQMEGDGSEAPGTATATMSNGAFNDNSPYGDAKRDGVERPSATTQSGDARDPCAQSDRTFAAGRNAIARKDKSLELAFNAYDSGDYAKAFEQFNIGYKKIGYDDAGTMIGNMYLYGQGVKQDSAKAIEWYTKVGNARYKDDQLSPYDPKHPETASPRAEAMVKLARMHLAGIGTAKDPKAARRWYQGAQELNYIPARFSYARMLLAGVGGDKDAAKAIKLLTSAAEYGYAPAQYTLAKLYDEGELTARDPARAFAWYQQAAFNPAPDAMKPHAELALARMYDQGVGTKADPARALAFYKAAAVSGHPEAQNALATYFYEGGLVKQDLALARKLFIAASTQGQRDAMANAGVMLFKGEGGAVDVVQSYVWLSLAARLGHAQAPAMVALVEKSLNAEQRSKAMAVLQPKAKG